MPDVEPDGLTSWMSSYDMAETMNRLRAAVADHGMTTLAHIDHGLAAAQAGLDLLPMELLIFGNAHVGTPLMRAAPTIGIDLPLKVLVWTDDGYTTWLAYNDPGWFAARHGARSGTDRVLSAMREALAYVAGRATQRETSVA